MIGVLVVVSGAFLLAARLGPLAAGPEPTATAAATSTASPLAVAGGTPVPAGATFASPQELAQAFIAAWQKGDYAAMYPLISSAAQSHISQADFVKRYQDIAAEMGQQSITVTLGTAAPGAMRLPIHVVRQTSRVGTLTEDNVIPIIREQGQYRVDWTPSLIVADLGDGYVRWVPVVPQRGRILDRKGRPLAELGMVDKVGVIPGQIKDENALLESLSQLLNLPKDVIKQRYANGQPDWFMPITTLPDPVDPQLAQKLLAIPGVVIRQWPDRVYPLGPAAAHITGYLTEISADELAKYADRGYEVGDRIGRAGIEAWGEQYLSGKRGGRLVIVGPDGQERKLLAEVPSQPAADIVLTIDADLQQAAYKALGDKVGSIVVLDPNTGAILAMASNPSFDPNQFILGMTPEAWNALNDPQKQPLVNRATQMAYPTGSTFKVVTMAAALEKLGMTAQTRINCPATFSLPGSSQVWHDWSPNGQGVLTLHNALVQSCDTVFYQIGAQLDEHDPNLLPQMARGFGFGSQTGLAELPEVAGLVPDPTWKRQQKNDYWARGDAVNLAIGQGFFLATPLQLADAYAAIANGGTLWEPYLVQEVVAVDGTKLYTHQPKARGTLPVSPQHLADIRSALHDVTSAPNGTAVTAFRGEKVPVAGKTGTAESGQQQPHAWFAEFAPVDGAKLAAVVMIEHGGEGSVTAAPLARQMVDAAVQAGIITQ